ncbi:MAG: GNAT family N-acetyltransferase [Clostridia bacterium]|nr:GNAT family N-acetyltransferase [Clostridia bacterium]
MNFKLKQIDNQNLNILKNLFQLYIHDISKELPWDCDDNGIFEAYSLSEWIENKDNFGYLVYIEDKLAGFVMVDKEFKVLENQANSYNLSEIFILNNYKGKGLASSVVKQVFNIFKGNWECRPVPKSISALTFWERVFKNNFPYNVTKHEWKENRFAFTFKNI